MSPILLTIICLVCFASGYLIYSKCLAIRIHRSNSDTVIPADQLHDNIDYITTNKFILALILTFVARVLRVAFYHPRRLSKQRQFDKLTRLESGDT